MARKKNRQKDYKRADYPEQKDERRQLILRSAAEELSLVGSSADFTVNALAQRAGLAKGTVYLYFKSKNAILIELLGDAIEDFLVDIVVKFSKLPEPVNAKQAASTIRDALKISACERRLPQLLKSRSDKDSGTSHQYKYQKRIKPFMERADAIIVSRLHGLHLGEGNKILRYGWALLLGLSDIADHQPKPAVTPIDVEQDLREALTRLIEGYLTRSR
jgi:AcrR family transcriptional regulator